jgi:hypothetical protein
MSNNKQQVQVKFPENLISGVYANVLNVSHTPEEFVMDFLMVAPPSGSVCARIITSPGHMKRIIAALQANLEKYERTFGKIKPAAEPKHESNIGFKRTE